MKFKRSICIFLSCLLVVASLAVPAFSDPLDLIQDFLADSTFSLDSLTISPGKPVNVHPALQFVLFYAEFVVRGSVSSATFNGIALDVVSLGNGLYKLVFNRENGSVVQKDNASLVVNGSSSFFGIVSIRGSRSSFSLSGFSYSLNSQLFHADGTSVQGSFVSGTAGNYPYSTEVTQTSGLFASSFQFKLSVSQPFRFDVLQLDAVVTAGSIGSVSCSIPGALVTFDVTPFAGDVQRSLYYLHILVDLSNVSNTNSLDLIITGAPSSNGSTYNAKLTVSTLLGFVSASDLASLNFLQRIGLFFSNLGSSISSGFSNVVSSISGGLTSAVNSLKSSVDSLILSVRSGFQSILDKLDMIVNGDQEAADDFSQVAGNASSSLGSAGSAIDAISKPGSDGFNISVDSMVDSDALSLVILPVRSIFSDPFFSALLLISFTLMLVGYVLFGKR